MIRLNKRILFYIGLLCVTLMAWGMCLSNAQKVQQLEEIVELRYASDTLTLKEIKRVQKGEAESENKLISNLIAWRQSPKKVFKNKALEKSMEGDLVEVYGQLDLLLPQGKMTGQQLYEGDREGAIITQTVAYDLWGSGDVVGKTFYLDDKEYVVRGILKEKAPSIIIQVDLKEDTQFSAIRMQFVDTGNVEEHLTTLKVKYNLPEGIPNNLSLKSISLSYLAFLPGCLLGFYGLFKLYHFIYKTYHYWVSALILSVIAILATWLMVEIVQFSWHIPSYIIPNEWSDFDFWSSLAEKMRQNKEALQGLPSFLPDAWYKVVRSNLMASCAVTLLGILVLVRKVKIKKEKELFLSVLLAITISFASIIFLHGVGEEVWATKAFWVVIPSYLAIDFIITKWKTFLQTEIEQ